MSDSTRKSDSHYAIGKKNPNLPFHPAVRAGDYIFVSGQVSKDADGNMMCGSIEVETEGTIRAIERILAEEGATLADVCRVVTYLDDPRDFGRYNKVFGQLFDGAVLSRTTIEARAVITTKIEMDAIAYKPLADKG
ncbi:RidA family protein [Amorphus orientalis]|uniref:Enamine deaminase RidA (YjgF/YER057c/UK114 family) n=1 Tax=Amorphus orientalis TaxID=649198 RepID=A0AAE3VSP1_9HYPH|nr:RidA family protein [Amorphus orientalis]MDQ0317416.1 enamine deaminase RidA (YjgF/YER057c/UK114 family) [Amorphus orientalis]